MSKRIKYDFRNQESFIIYLLPFLILLLCFSMSVAQLVILAICYLLAALLLFRFSYRAVRVTESGLIIINNLKPFKKIYRYSYKDLLEVFVGNAKGIRITFIFRDKKRFSISMPYNREKFCKFFLDKEINVSSNNEDLKHFIAHYHNNPGANYVRRQTGE